MVVVVGYIPHELTLATNQAGDYILKFNVRTFDNEGTPCLIPCIADTKIAKNLYDEFEERDTLVVWGQLRHKYSQKYHQTFLQLKVISYSIVVDLDDFLYEPSMSEEKKSFLKKMLLTLICKAICCITPFIRLRSISGKSTISRPSKPVKNSPKGKKRSGGTCCSPRLSNF